MSKKIFETIGIKIGQIVEIKNKQYGDSAAKCSELLKILYPDGVNADQYSDMMLVTRVLDKLSRVAAGKLGEENPWLDIAGYGILGVSQDEKKGH